MNTITKIAIVPSLVFAAMFLVGPPVHAQNVCATVPELGSLVREIGGEQVTVTVFARGTEDPHFVEARPSFVKALSKANLFVIGGLSLESGWVPALLQGARNPAVGTGGRGFLDTSVAIEPLQVLTGRVDRSQGDVHPGGNPHYLSDPINGLKVARLIRAKLIELRPEQRTYYEDRYTAFAQKVARHLVGEELLEKYTVEDVPKLALLHEHGELRAFLKREGQDQLLGGWLGMMEPYYAAKAVDDHNMWPYFAKRFGIQIVAHLEPKPGIPPTTAHLRTVVERMKADKIRVVLANAYYDPRHAQFVANQTGAKVVNMAHQVGARPGTDNYLAMVDYNVRQLAESLGAGK